MHRTNASSKCVAVGLSLAVVLASCGPTEPAAAFAIDRALAGEPDAETRRGAELLTASLEAWEIDYLTSIDWNAVTPEQFLSDPVIAEAIEALRPVLEDVQQNQSALSGRVQSRQDAINEGDDCGCPKEARDEIAETLREKALKIARGAAGGSAVCLFFGLGAPACVVAVIGGVAVKVGITVTVQTGVAAVTCAGAAIISSACASEDPIDPAAYCREQGEARGMQMSWDAAQKMCVPGTGGSSCPAPPQGQCNGLPIGMVANSYSTPSPAPTATGGTIEPGRYVLDEFIYNDDPDGSITPTEDIATTLEICGTGFQNASQSSNSTEIFRGAGTFTVSGNALTFNYTCPMAGADSGLFTASPGVLIFSTPSGDQTLVYRKQ